MSALLTKSCKFAYTRRVARVVTHFSCLSKRKFSYDDPFADFEKDKRMQLAMTEHAFNHCGLTNVKKPFNMVLVCGLPTEDQIEQLANLSFVTVFSVCHEGIKEQKEIVEKYGLKFVSLPLEPDLDTFNMENVRLFDKYFKELERPAIIHGVSTEMVGSMFALRESWLKQKRRYDAITLGVECGLVKNRSTIHNICPEDYEEMYKPRETAHW